MKTIKYCLTIKADNVETLHNTIKLLNDSVDLIDDVFEDSAISKEIESQLNTEEQKEYDSLQLSEMMEDEYEVPESYLARS